MDGYARNRQIYQSISGSLAVAAATDDTTLVALKAKHTIFIQKLNVTITGASAGKTWQFVDSNGTPKQIAGPYATDVDGVSFKEDFGADGVPLTEAKAFALDVSAAGAAGHIEWEGYMKPTAVLTPFD